jgi:hypothetical protein
LNQEKYINTQIFNLAVLKTLLLCTCGSISSDMMYCWVSATTEENSVKTVALLSDSDVSSCSAGNACPVQGTVMGIQNY